MALPVFTFANDCKKDVAGVCSVFEKGISSSFLCFHSFFCVSLTQEGQVLECSLINSIRVGAVPKVRRRERHFPPLLFTQHSRSLPTPLGIQRRASTPAPLNKSSQTAALLTLQPVEALAVCLINLTDPGSRLKPSLLRFHSC